MERDTSTIVESSEDGGDSLNNSSQSFQLEGNNSNTSLSVHFDRYEEVVPKARSYSSLPAYNGHGSSLNAFSNSLSSIRSTPAPRQRQYRQNRDNEFNNASMSSVRSFADWNGNERIGTWPCPQCTYQNDPLHLACDVCGHRRERTGQSSTNDVAAVAAVSDEEEYVAGEQMRELVEMQREILGSFGSGRAYDTTAMYQAIDAVDSSEEEEDRLENLIQMQKDILLDFKRKRESDEETRFEKKPAARLKNDLLQAPDFGQNMSNSVPLSLSESMKAAGGVFQLNDLCLPVLWGDDLGSLKKDVQKSNSQTL
jgi:hypothetical protein